MRDLPKSAMIFAAGRGTRMAPLTDTKPKPLIELGGKALLDHALDLLAGFETIVVNAHYLGDQVDAHLIGRATVIHEPVLLETGGGLKNALPLLGEGPVLTINSDAVFTKPNVVDGLLSAWRPQMEALLSVVPQERAIGHKRKGDFLVDEAGRLTRGFGVTYTGVQIIRPERVSNQADRVFSMNLVWDQMIDDRTLFGHEFPGLWCDVGQPDSLPLAEELVHV